MKWFPSLFAAVLLVTSLTGCVGTPLSAADRARVKKVGVVSLLGNEVRGSFASLTVFTNQQYDEPAPELGVDAFIENEMVRVLNEKRGPAAKALAADRATMIQRTKPGGLNAVLGGMQVDPAKVAAVVPEIARREQLDAVIVMWPLAFDERGIHTRGVYLASGTFGSDGFYAGVLVGADVRDGATGKVLGSASFSGVPGYRFGPVQLPDGTKVPWRKHYSEYNAAEREAIREDLHRNLKTAIPVVLQRCGLVGRA